MLPRPLVALLLALCSATSAQARAQSDVILPVVQAPGIRQVIIASEALGGRVSYEVLVPPEYDRDSTRRFPVLYWLHGSGGGRAGIAPLAALFLEAMRRGQLPATLVVFPNGRPLSLWVDAADGSANIERFVLRELIPDVDRRFRTLARRQSRGVDGFSMGGYGALRFGFGYPELFGAASSLAGGPLQEDLLNAPRAGRARARQVLQSVFDGDPAAFRAASPRQLASQYARRETRPELAVRVAIGTRDVMLDATREFSAHLRDLDIAHEYIEVPGVDHEPLRMLSVLGDAYWAFWRRHLAP